MKKLIIILLCILITCSSIAFAKEKDTTITPIAKNIVYGDLSLGWILFYTSCSTSFNYERIIDNWLSIRIGYGYSNFSSGSIGGTSKYGEYHGLLAIINIHTKGNKKFNIGGGVSYIDNTYPSEKEGFYFIPAFCISYRYQPLNGSFYFSVGGIIAFSVIGINLGIGHIF